MYNVFNICLYSASESVKMTSFFKSGIHWLMLFFTKCSNDEDDDKTINNQLYHKEYICLSLLFLN